jgi:hypothetical protein
VNRRAILASEPGYRRPKMTPWGSLPVRLEPRDRTAGRRDGDREGRSRPSLPQPDAVLRAYPRETREMVFDAHDRAFGLFKGAAAAASTTT